MAHRVNPLPTGKAAPALIRIPGSKSHTIRALLIATLADGESLIRDPLVSADTLSCLEACRKLGARIRQQPGLWRVMGTGGCLLPPKEPIDVGNSGTTLYLATALASLSDQPVTFDGDGQIRRRSADNLLKALEGLGVSVQSAPGGCAPYTITGPLRGGQIEMSCPTSQYLSGILLAAPLALGNSEVKVPLLYEKPYVTMTLDWMKRQGIVLEYDEDYTRFLVPGGQKFHPFERSVPADFSSATFFLCAAAITGSAITLSGLDMNDSQGDKKVVDMLADMGCSFRETGDGLVAEPGKLVGRDLDLNDTPDALPALAVTACYAEGTTRLLNVPQARIKETDRIAVMASELSRLGAKVEELPDGLVIKGGGGLMGGNVSGHEDHRVIMAMALAGLRSDQPVEIDDIRAAGITFPEFFDLFGSLYPG